MSIAHYDWRSPPTAPGLLQLWRTASLPLADDVAGSLRQLLANVEIMERSGLALAVGGNAARAAGLALTVLRSPDGLSRNVALSALLLRAADDAACRMILEKARVENRSRLAEQAVAEAVLGDPTCRTPGPTLNRRLEV